MEKKVSILALFFLFSCLQSKQNKKKYCDSIIQNYVAMINSSGNHDTTDMAYKILKACSNNDIASLKKIDSFIFDKKYNRENWDLWQSDIPLLQLKNLNAREAYRFVFSIYNSSAHEVITVYRKDTLFKLHYLFYAHNVDDFKFKKIKELEKQIIKKQWDELIAKIDIANYWELKNETNNRGDDGYDLTVIGYINLGNYEKSQYVHRWTSTKLNEAFYYIYYKLLDKKERQF